MMSTVHFSFPKLVLLMSLALVELSSAQPMKYYRAVQATRTYTALTSSTGTQISWPGPNGQTVTTLPQDVFSKDSIPIGFPFVMNGKTYTYLRPCSNGFVLLGGKAGTSSGATEYKPDWSSGGENGDCIALYQANVTMNGAYYKSSPTEFVLQYQGLIIKPTVIGYRNPISEQIRLVKGVPNIEYTFMRDDAASGGSTSSGSLNATIGILSSSAPLQFCTVVVKADSFNAFTKFRYSDSVHLYNNQFAPKSISSFDFIVKYSRNLAATSLDEVSSSLPASGAIVTPKATFTNLGWDSLSVQEPVNIRYEIFNAKQELMYVNDTTLPQTLKGGVSGDVYQMVFRDWTVTDTSHGYIFRAIALANNEDSVSFRMNDTVTAVLGTIDPITYHLRDLAAVSIDNLPSSVPVAGDSLVPTATFLNVGTATLLETDPLPIRFEIYDATQQMVYWNDTTLPADLVSSTSQQMHFATWHVTGASKGYIFRAIALLANEDSASFRANDTITSVVGDTTVSVSDERELTNGFFLGQNYPNPFSQSTTIPLTVTGAADFDVVDMLGRTVYRENLDRATTRIIFPASGLPGGLYLYRVRSGIARTIARSMNVLR